MLRKFALALPLCLLFVPLCLAQQTIEATSLGTVTLSELAKQKYPEPLSRDIEHESQRRRPERLQSLAAAWDVQPAAPTIAVPPVSTRFSSIGSGSLSPGDAAGAVGKNHVVTATNAGIVVHSRSGAQLASTPLKAFLAIAAGDNGIYTDPRIVYDAGNDRWIVFGLRLPRYLVLAVSNTGDPLGAWTRYVIDSSKFANSIDYSRLALTRDTIVAVTYEGDANNGYPLSIHKSDLYSLPSSLPVKQYLAGIVNVPVSGEESEYEYILGEDETDRNSLILSRLDQLNVRKKVAGAIPWSRAETAAPQLGSSRKLDTGFMDVEAAVIRSGIIYAVNLTAMSAPTRTSIIWRKFDAETGKYLGGGLIDDPTGVKYYAYSSIAVNRAGGIVIGFNTFTAAQYPSAGYVYIDAHGAISNEGVLKAGETPSSTTRWGDYSTTVVDPTDDATFWTIQEATAENHWVAWW
ncbi:MAG TPA: hypothetical protein VK648_13435, partial [Gemmatimonadaceae bacterium]|nr:hypothetical protein [Gemmatimonadaceae bacterium]